MIDKRNTPFFAVVLGIDWAAFFDRCTRVGLCSRIQENKSEQIDHLLSPMAVRLLEAHLARESGQRRLHLPIGLSERVGIPRIAHEQLYFFAGRGSCFHPVNVVGILRFVISDAGEVTAPDMRKRRVLVIFRS